MHNPNKTIDFFSAVDFLNASQDTTLNQNQSIQVITKDTVIPDSASKEGINVNVNTIKPIDFAAIDSILRQSEEREQQIKQQQQQEPVVRKWYRPKLDTTELLYKQFGIAGFPISEKLEKDPFTHNILYNIPIVIPEKQKITQNVFIEGSKKSIEPQKSYQSVSNQKEIELKQMPGRLQFDWITILLIGSFLLLGWIRLLNKKYLGLLVKSVVSYQEANSLYREKNSFMEKASFMVNVLFLSNVSVFAIQLKYFWNLKLEGIDDWKLYFIVFTALLSLYIFRALSSLFIGSVFLKQRVFTEYFHNVNIYTKTTGLFLLPVVVTLQFLSYQYIDVIVYFGLFIIGALYLLLLLRSFQIIIRKNVSIFYMILYLCAFEFAPFLILYKLLLSLS